MISAACFADAAVAILLRCRLRKQLSEIATIVFTITNVASKVLFAVEALQGTTALRYAYFAAQLGILAVSHLTGFAVIIPLLRLEAARARASQETRLEVELLIGSLGLYTVVLVLGSANLQVLAILPWRERQYGGLPSARLLRLASLSMAVTDVPQIFLQSTYIAIEGRRSDLTISTISLSCSVLGIFYRCLNRWILCKFAGAKQPLTEQLLRGAPAQVESSLQPSIQELIQELEAATDPPVIEQQGLRRPTYWRETLD